MRPAMREKWRCYLQPVSRARELWTPIRPWARRHQSGPVPRPWTKLSLDFKANDPKIARASLRLASMWSDFPDAFAHGSPTLAASADACAEPALR